MPYDPEKQMLRELVWWYLGMDSKDVCHFCQRPLLVAEGINRTFGHRRHTKVTARLTIHHLDEARDNNARTNTVPCHSVCHKRYHNEKRKIERESGSVQNTSAEEGLYQ